MATVSDLAKIGYSPIIPASVGRGGRNKPIDVGIVQYLLNRAYPGMSTVDIFDIDGQADTILGNWIEAFQTDAIKRGEIKLGKPDGQAGKDGETIRALRKRCAGSFLPPLYGQAQTNLWNELNAETMLRLTELQFEPLSQASKDGFRYLFRRIVYDMGIYDLRWGAYMLATIRWETKKTYLPIEEDEALWKKHADKGQYADEITATNAAGEAYKGADGKPLKYRYYGRGYVQLTLLKNYRALGERLGLGDALVKDPSLALDPDTAYKIASIGMQEGLFASDSKGAPMTLQRFIDGNKCHYDLARQIINGLDHADDIAGFATVFEVLMLLSTSGPPKGV
jgi:hypothetical protein